MSELKTSQFSVRCEPDLAEKVRKNAQSLGGDPPLFIRRCLEEICEMIENPDKNDLPEIVAMLRFVRAYKKSPTPLKVDKGRKTA